MKILESRRLAVLFLAIAAIAAACTSEKRPADARGTRELKLLSTGSYEELSGSVPDTFAEAPQWNRGDICPEGAALTPFTRYTYATGERSRGFKHYYGRACGVLTSRTEAGKAKVPATTFVPHGPFIWWYEDGKKMKTGAFAQGAISGDWLSFEPNGAIAATR